MRVRACALRCAALRWSGLDGLGWAVLRSPYTTLLTPLPPDPTLTLILPLPLHYPSPYPSATRTQPYGAARHLRGEDREVPVERLGRARDLVLGREEARLRLVELPFLPCALLGQRPLPLLDLRLEGALALLERCLLPCARRIERTLALLELGLARVQSGRAVLRLARALAALRNLFFFGVQEREGVSVCVCMDELHVRVRVHVCYARVCVRA